MSTIKELEDGAYAVQANDLIPLANNAGDTAKSVIPRQLGVAAGSPVSMPAGLGGVNTSVNVLVNAISSAIHSATISGGGTVSGPNTILANSDYGTIAGGYDNTIEHIAGTISGGAHHVLQDTASSSASFGINCSHGTIGGGSSNEIIGGEYCTIGGGGGATNPNKIIGNSAVISGGISNEVHSSGGTGASGGANTIGGGDTNIINTEGGANTIAGGNTNTIGDDTDTTTAVATISGGSGNTIIDSPYALVASGALHDISAVANYGCIVGGYDNGIVGSQYSLILNGKSVVIDNTAHYAVAYGDSVLARIPGSFNHTGKNNGTAGDLQHIQFTMGNITTDATPNERLSVYGTTSYPELPDDTVWSGEAFITGIEPATGDVCSYYLQFTCKRISDVETLVAGPTGSSPAPGSTVAAVALGNENSIAGAAPNIELHSTGLLIPRVTGSVAKTINWGATIKLVQVK